MFYLFSLSLSSARMCLPKNDKESIQKQAVRAENKAAWGYF